MKEWVEGGEKGGQTVSVWTPWGEQKVLRSDGQVAALRRAAKRLRGSDESGLAQNFADQIIPMN